MANLTVAQAITRSVNRDEIVTLDWSAEAAADLSREDSVHYPDIALTEYWGADDDGNAWIVRLRDADGVTFNGSRSELGKQLAEKIRDLNETPAASNWAVGLNEAGEVDCSHEGARGLRICLVEQAGDLDALGVELVDGEWTTDTTHGLADCFVDWLNDHNQQASDENYITFTAASVKNDRGAIQSHERVAS